MLVHVQVHVQMLVQVQVLVRGACAGAGACAYVQVPQVQVQVHDLADAISKIACKLLVHEHPTDSLKLPKAEHY